MPDARSSAYDRLGVELAKLWDASALTNRAVERALGISSSTFRGWREGRTAPDPADEEKFWTFVHFLRPAADGPVPGDAELAVLLRAAQADGKKGRGKQSPAVQRNDPDRSFIRVHGPALETSAAELRGRTSERSDMNSFVKDRSSRAPRYLCLQADAPVGKTALLADYVRHRPPPDVDILTYFVSSAHGNNSRARFEEEMARQIGELLGRQMEPGPSTVREWKRRFAESVKRNRTLLLVVDGLDDDVAWSGVAAASDSRPARGSIAALLPAPPPPAMRVIVSVRRRVRFPDDLPPHHPLRRKARTHTLLPVAGVPLLRMPRPDTAALSGPVAGLLAVSGGGLRTADLAELTGLPADRIDRLVHGPAGRALVLDDPVLRTYSLAEPGLILAVREDLGEDGVARHDRALRAWAQRWSAAGWPHDTPPYPLALRLRTLTDTAERAAYVLDMPRLRRLAHTAGPAVALAQLDALHEEIPQETVTADALATLVPLAAARDLLRGETREVSDGAPALLVRLGEVQRARGLARSAPTPAACAVHLAEVAVETAYAGGKDVDAVVLEAVELLARDRAGQGSPGGHTAPETYARLLSAARALAGLNRPGAARSLVRAVVHHPAVGVDSLIEAAGMLDMVQDCDVARMLHDRAEMLSAGGTLARTGSVELWAVLARAVPSFGPCAGDRIEAVCQEIGPADGLGAVDVLAGAASALACLPAKRPNAAAARLREALARTARVVAGPEDANGRPPSEDDQAHLRRELAGTLARLARAVIDTGATGSDLDDFGRLLDSLPEHLHIGVLGGSVRERARWFVESARERIGREEREASATAKETVNARRRRAEAGNAAYNEELKTKHGAGGKQARAAVEATRRPRRHRRSTGLPAPDTSPQAAPPHLLLLQEAEDRLSAGDHLRARELLESALQCSPVSRASSNASRDPGSEHWTADLCQALGSMGEFDEGAALAECRSDPEDRARHLAALSLGCSLGGHDTAGSRYADKARVLVPERGDPRLANLVAQALAHAGDASAASAMASGAPAAQRRQARTAVAAGLVRHRPEEAARIAEPLVEALVRRIGEPGRPAPLPVLPELAALLLAFPDVRQPDPRLRDALRQVALRMAGAPVPDSAPAMAVLALLERLGCLPDEAANAVTAVTERWRRSPRPGQDSCAEVALSAAVEGDITTVWRLAEALRAPDERSLALAAVAARLCGAPVALSTRHRADDRVVRICLALAHRCADSGPRKETPAREAVQKLLESGAWARAVPVLPWLAPGALTHLSTIARDLARP
ncbi:hypothetical protein ACFV6Z_32935 [Streptomyces sp. NPDC059818]|uniref:hypothetical protein n=1 Tax=Streptomyces sp. NPDC059818 TaxID=3346962 RepID=UPI00365D02FB